MDYGLILFLYYFFVAILWNTTRMKLDNSTRPLYLLKLHPLMITPIIVSILLYEMLLIRFYFSTLIRSN